MTRTPAQAAQPATADLPGPARRGRICPGCGTATLRALHGTERVVTGCSLCGRAWVEEQGVLLPLASLASTRSAALPPLASTRRTAS